MYNPVVQLKSGGYLVINPTEALVSIDINSGRSTREHGIEATAVGTNLEAAKEIARQLRLRDMAGLVVIDFIDMEHNSNVRKVEKAMKTALADDRARIQVGRISSFGLMEMSRQRLRTGVLEASTRTCPHCEGSGLVRTASSAGLSALRQLEEEAARGHGSRLTLRASQEAAFYVLNRKRGELAEIEERYGVSIDVLSDGEVEGARMTVEAGGPPPAFRPKYETIVDDLEDDIIDDIDDEDEEEEEIAEPRGERESRDDGKKRSRRRRGRRGKREDGDERPEETSVATRDPAREDGDDAETAEPSSEDHGGLADEDGGAKRKRRGRRGGRRRRGGRDEAAQGDGAEGAEEAAESDALVAEPDGDNTAIADAPDSDIVAPAPKARRKRAVKAEAPAEAAVVDVVVVDAAPAEKPKRARKKMDAEPEAGAAPMLDVPSAEDVTPTKAKRVRKKAEPVVDVTETSDAPPAPTDEADGSPRKGWWQRTFGAEE
jgi:ribonuclease E